MTKGKIKFEYFKDLQEVENFLEDENIEYIDLKFQKTMGSMFRDSTFILVYREINKNGMC